ncbi:hypothetical protein [Shewanella surugensis]|uniref:MYM-type domain-containing protein n=1 Tax=Shewanella surugensis TaxID=212020 RepID=A0ABT0LBE3_9GAMM|nr:hypothetical protein [Shewanella surugensis]MCL1125026.1 hypothetical protein [Shewanella surugensis]
MTKMDFSTINKTTTQSYNEQKNMIKRVFKGQSVLCKVCGQALLLKLPVAHQPSTLSGIYCKKGCTDLELDMEHVN